MSAFDTLNRSGLSMLANGTASDADTATDDRIKAYMAGTYPDHRMAFAYVRGLISTGGEVGGRLAATACNEWERLIMERKA